MPGSPSSLDGWDDADHPFIHDHAYNCSPDVKNKLDEELAVIKHIEHLEISEQAKKTLKEYKKQIEMLLTGYSNMIEVDNFLKQKGWGLAQVKAFESRRENINNTFNWHRGNADKLKAQLEVQGGFVEKNLEDELALIQRDQDSIQHLNTPAKADLEQTLRDYEQQIEELRQSYRGRLLMEELLEHKSKSDQQVTKDALNSYRKQFEATRAEANELRDKLKAKGCLDKEWVPLSLAGGRSNTCSRSARLFGVRNASTQLSTGKWVHGNKRMREARRCLRDGQFHPENEGFNRY